MNAEFNVWLLIVGLVVGAGLTWVATMDARRRESEIDEVERPREAAWLSAILAEDGYDVSPDAADQLLQLHRAYLEAPPPDEVEMPAAVDRAVEPSVEPSVHDPSVGDEDGPPIGRNPEAAVSPGAPHPSGESGPTR